MSSFQHGDDDIFRFQIPVDNIVLVQILEREKHLSCIICHIVLQNWIELSNFAQHRAALNILKLKVQVLSILKRAKNAHEKGTLWHELVIRLHEVFLFFIVLISFVNQILQHFSLRNDMIYVLHLGHTLLFQYFKCTNSIIFFFVYGFVYSSKTTYTNNFLHFKVCYFWFFCFCDSSACLFFLFCRATCSSNSSLGLLKIQFRSSTRCIELR